MTLELLAFILYFALVLGIGVIFFFKSNKNKMSGDKEYFLGGRQMGPYVTAMSAQASDMSGWLLMGFPGSVLAFGFGKVWIGIGLALGTIANWIFVAKRLRRFSKAANDSITLPQYLSNRFATKNPALQIICAIIFLVFFTVYVASSFVAGATVFAEIVPQLKGKESLAMLIFAVIIIIYTFLGGFKAVCWTDFFQGIMMLIAVLAVPIVILCTQNLDFSALNQVYSYMENGNAVECAFVSNPFAASWQDIVSGLAWGLGYFGMPHILVRFMSIKKSSMIKKSATVAIVWVVLSLGAAIAFAVLGRVLVGEELLSAGLQKNVFIRLVQMLFPPFIIGILLSAIIAAAMSTADSQLLVASSSFTSDIYKPVFRKNASDKEVLWIGRVVVLIIAVIAYFIASSKSSGAQSIMNMVENAWGGFGSAFGGVIILSVFWKRLTYKGAVAGVAFGAIVDVLWLVFLTSSTGIYELLPGFFAGLLAAVVVSLIDKQPNAEVVKIYETATDKSIDD
ncbi:MAG: sodium/proline symporter PutP [Acutalibacteraceae bacterium]|nr:sodium/proline symporter PutP [Acutalibacteraceae bacterium]